jgi:hypothetical protein
VGPRAFLSFVVANGTSRAEGCLGPRAVLQIREKREIVSKLESRPSSP